MQGEDKLRELVKKKLKISKTQNNSVHAYALGQCNVSAEQIEDLMIEIMKVEDESQEKERQVHLWMEQISFSDKGCKFIGSFERRNLKRLFIYNNKIGNKGCQFLSKGQWPQLQNLNLNMNLIGSQGIKYLVQGNWPQLRVLLLIDNKIQSIGCFYLAKAYWPNLLKLALSNNSILDEGCRYLMKANWPQLQQIQVCLCKVSQKGCLYLSRMNCKPHPTVKLFGNCIGKGGYRSLKNKNMIIWCSHEYKQEEENQ